MIVGNNRADMAHSFGAEVGSDFSAEGVMMATDVTGEKTGGPGIAGAVGINRIGDRDWLDAVEFVAFGDPSTVFTYFDGGDNAFTGEPTSE